MVPQRVRFLFGGGIVVLLPTPGARAEHDDAATFLTSPDYFEKLSKKVVTTGNKLFTKLSRTLTHPNYSTTRPHARNTELHCTHIHNNIARLQHPVSDRTVAAAATR